MRLDRQSQTQFPKLEQQEKVHPNYDIIFCFEKNKYRKKKIPHKQQGEDRTA
jgi:hypothetical protein